MIVIRQEKEADYPQVYRLVQEAFAAAEHTDGDEQNLVVRLRSSAAFVPALSLVAEEDGLVVGYLLFTEIGLGGLQALAAAPLAVLPAHQGRGIGMALLAEGHRIARDLGYVFSVLLGHPDYYPRAGYLPASRFGISCPMEVPEECFMALNLQGGDLRAEATVVYAPEFFQ